MKRPRTMLLIGGLIAGAGSFALVAGTMTLMSLTSRDGATPVLIQQSFEDVRLSDGHLNHLATRQVACRDCHEITEEAGQERFSRPTAEVCSTCHEDQVGEIHHDSNLGRASADCLACHDFIDDDNVRPWNCLRCHEEPRGFARAIELHAEAPCSSCHRPHEEPSLVPRACGDSGCHDIAAVRHGSQVIDGSGCLDCHQIHDALTDAPARCADCHLRTEPRVSAAAIRSGHTCTSCHTPHQFTGKSTASCASCHDRVETLAATTARPHARCQSCHPAHDPSPRGDASCRGCHSKVVPSHGDAPSCLGCHPVHELSAGQTALACSSCHDGFGSDTAHAGGMTCTQCHEPHRFDAVAPAPRSCTTCHPAQVVASRGTGHADCAGCHGGNAQHQPQAAPACATCHAPQARTLTLGHGDCASCHTSSHRGAVGGEPACASCHRDRARGNHASIAGGCSNCHRAHGPEGQAKPPTCQSCHQVSALPALHQVPRHQLCASCHDAHEATPRADRATCIACHKEQKSHEPDAKRCDGCHLFTRSQ